MIWLVLSLSFLGYAAQTATIIWLDYMHPRKAMAWLVFCCMLPGLGLLFYVWIGKQYARGRQAREKRDGQLADWLEFVDARIERLDTMRQFPDSGIREQRRLVSFLTGIEGAPVTARNRVHVFSDASEAFSAMMDAMQQARDHIHVQFYIIRGDDIGKKWRQLLSAKAQEGVRVRVLCDGVGSYGLSEQFIAPLRQAGVSFHRFLPPKSPLWLKRLNYRNHRKIVIVDGAVGFTGGLNIGDEYLGRHARIGYWRDAHLQVEGDAVYALQHTFLTDWHFVSGEQLGGSALFPLHRQTAREPVQIIPSGPEEAWNGTLKLYFAAIAASQSHIYMATPYFIPDYSISTALLAAAASGADVRIMLPAKPDSRLVHWASRSYVEPLLEAGVKFYEYQKGFIHSKVLIIDGMLASVGTANTDMRSFSSNFEINAVLLDPRTIAGMENEFRRDLRDCTPLRLEWFRKRSTKERVLEVLGRLCSPLL